MTKQFAITHEEKSSEVRLNKYISESGFTSRREADKLIESGKVKVNGVTAITGLKVSSGDVVEVCGKVISNHQKPVWRNPSADN